MKEIIRILMERDGLTFEEAKEMCLDCCSEIADAINGTNCADPVDILADELGLEPDYLICFI